MSENRKSSRTLAAVLNWCDAEDSAACIHSILRTTGGQPDILIVDNASPDGSGDVLRTRFSGLHFLQTGANLGYAGGNARAAAWALQHGYEYLLVINDDAEVDPQCVPLLVAVLDRDAGVAACAPTVLHHGTNRIWFGGGRFNQLKAMGVHEHAGELFNATSVSASEVQDATFLSGCVVLFRCSALREHGSFREEFFAYAEDLELSIRLVRAGLKLRYVPAATATHKIPFPSPADSTFAIRQRDTNRRRVVALHYSAAQRLQFASWFYPTRAVHFVRYLLSGNWNRLRAIWSGAFSSLDVQQRPDA